MRLWHYGIGFSLALGIGLGGSAGCAAGTTQNPTGTGGSTTGTGGTGTGGGTFTSSSTSSGGTGGEGGFGACAKFNAEAQQSPAALMFILDGSASMNGTKWSAAQLAVVQAIDTDVFDTMSLGLLTFPTGFQNPPGCICAYLGFDPQDPQSQQTCNALLAPGVSCGVSPLAQIPIQAAGTNKSNASTGVRHDIYQYLVTAHPLSNSDDGSPIYDALVSGYNTLKGTNIDKRIAVLITDGGFSCTSVANPARPGYPDGYQCPDWEYPDAVNKLISDARQDPTKPINTFIIGVPGSNSHATDPMFPYAVPPYSMLLALSTYAVSGSPDTVDASCDKSAVFSQTGADPTHPCHIDLSNGATFNAGALADAIAAIRGKALGCTYDLPDPPPGETIDPGQVNVVLTADGMDYVVPKRKDASDACQTDPCWDYDQSGKVELIGAACSTVSGAASAKVDIYVGCATIIK